MKIDAANNKVLCHSNLDQNLGGKGEFSMEYDYLVIAVGAQVNTFNTPGVWENCHFLKVRKFSAVAEILLHLKLQCACRWFLQIILLLVLVM